MNKMAKRCVGNMDGTLKLTVGRVYEVVNTTVGSFILMNDNDQIQAYPKHLFIDPEQMVEVPITDDKFNAPTKQHPAPLYCIGDIIDIRYTDEEALPNRILVNTIMMRKPGEWEYGVKLESSGVGTVMGEGFIRHRARNQHNAPVYKLATIQRRYAQGFRWVGNYSESTATEKIKKLRRSGLIQIAEIREAYDREGNFVTGKVAVWIRYRNPIGLDEALTKKLRAKEDRERRSTSPFRLDDIPNTIFIAHRCDPMNCGGHCGECE